MEQWRDVVGFEGLYEVSSIGRVRSVPRLDANKVPRGGIIMKQRLAPETGYYCVKLMKNGKPKLRRVHSLVIEAFKGPPMPGQICRHWDDVRTNNNEENLVWGTYADNKKDSIRNGTSAFGERNGGGGKLTEAKVREIKQRLKAGDRPCDLAEKFGVSRCTIGDIKAERSWAYVAAE